MQNLKQIFLSLHNQYIKFFTQNFMNEKIDFNMCLNNNMTLNKRFNTIG